MGERKVLNNYIPPDFDPSIIPRIKRGKNRTIETRMMLPFSLRCNTCGEYMYRGKKFNSRSEIVPGETYMGIRKFRFYIKCVVCSSEITFKTDPKNSDYECEYGASRNFEVWRDTEEAKEQVQKEREEEEKVDVMKSLENRTMDSKVEMDVLDALDEIKSINQRHQRVDTNKLLDIVRPKEVKLNANGLTDADEELVKSINFKARKADNVPSTTTDADSFHDDLIQTNSSRGTIGDKVGTVETVGNVFRDLKQQLLSKSTVVVESKKDTMPVIIRKKRKINEDTKQEPVAKKQESAEKNDVVNNKSTENALSGLMDYPDSD